MMMMMMMMMITNSRLERTQQNHPKMISKFSQEITPYIYICTYIPRDKWPLFLKVYALKTSGSLVRLAFFKKKKKRCKTSLTLKESFDVVIRLAEAWCFVAVLKAFNSCVL